MMQKSREPESNQWPMDVRLTSTVHRSTNWAIARYLHVLNLALWTILQKFTIDIIRLIVALGLKMNEFCGGSLGTKIFLCSPL